MVVAVYYERTAVVARGSNDPAVVLTALYLYGFARSYHKGIGSYAVRRSPLYAGVFGQAYVYRLFPLKGQIVFDLTADIEGTVIEACRLGRAHMYDIEKSRIFVKHYRRVAVLSYLVAESEYYLLLSPGLAAVQRKLTQHIDNADVVSGILSALDQREEHVIFEMRAAFFVQYILIHYDKRRYPVSGIAVRLTLEKQVRSAFDIMEFAVFLTFRPCCARKHRQYQSCRNDRRENVSLCQYRDESRNQHEHATRYKHYHIESIQRYRLEQVHNECFDYQIYEERYAEHQQNY